MLDFVRLVFKSRVLKLIYFHQLMGQDHPKRRRRRTLNPEAVPTIFQHVPQLKASTLRKHLIKRTVKSDLCDLPTFRFVCHNSPCRTALALGSRSSCNVAGPGKLTA